MTKTAEAVCESFCSFAETEVTLTFIRSSIFIVVRSTSGPVPWLDFCADMGGQQRRRASEGLSSFDNFLILQSLPIHPGCQATRLESKLKPSPQNYCLKRWKFFRDVPLLHLHCSCQTAGAGHDLISFVSKSCRIINPLRGDPFQGQFRIGSRQEGLTQFGAIPKAFSRQRPQVQRVRQLPLSDGWPILKVPVACGGSL